VSRVRVKERDSLGVVVIEVSGDVDPTAAGELRLALVRAIRHADPTRVVVDLRAAGDIAPEGIGAVVASGDVASDSGVLVSVRGARPEVAERLTVGGFPGAQVNTTAAV
jgi:anti-anti-sigma regulatory factor